VLGVIREMAQSKSLGEQPDEVISGSHESISNLPTVWFDLQTFGCRYDEYLLHEETNMCKAAKMQIEK